jgi:hypothetical protein
MSWISRHQAIKMLSQRTILRSMRFEGLLRRIAFGIASRQDYFQIQNPKS